jgi:hypothetical protein
MMCAEVVRTDALHAQAFCAEGVAEGNGLLAFVQHVIFPLRSLSLGVPSVTISRWHSCKSWHTGDAAVHHLVCCMLNSMSLFNAHLHHIYVLDWPPSVVQFSVCANDAGLIETETVFLFVFASCAGLLRMAVTAHSRRTSSLKLPSCRRMCTPWISRKQ